MTSDEKLARVARSLKDAGIEVLVMGGHAVRYYGVDRNTTDFDLVASVASPQALRALLPGIPLFKTLKEIPAWRSNDFARFEIGTLADGRQELMELWIRNHLLADFAAMKSRAEIGTYGGCEVAFLSLDDLLKSKETEREGDWQDIALLEEIRDARFLARAAEDDGVLRALANVRSRRGFSSLLAGGLLSDTAAVAKAIERCTHPVSYAFLAPLSPQTRPANLCAAIEPTSLQALSKAPFNAAIHMGVVEVVRRGYKRQAMEADRRDKQERLNEQR